MSATREPLHLIIGVGGSGQMILHYYSQLFVLGLVSTPFKAIVVDTDQTMHSLTFLRKFWADCRLALGDKGCVPTIGEVSTGQLDFDTSVRERLGYFQHSDDSRYEDPAQAFFSNDALGQSVAEGLFARPCLSAVIGLEEVQEGISSAVRAIKEPCRVVLVHSTIGGTGPGLALAALLELQDLVPSHALRTVFLGDYFYSGNQDVVDDVSKGKDVVDDVQTRFPSNKTLFLKTMEAAVPKLHAFAFVEEPRTTREAEESFARNLRWPLLQTPYWSATMAVHHLLRETTRDARTSFVEREVPSADYVNAMPHGAVLERISSAQAVVGTLIDNDVIHRISSEALPGWTWGESLNRPGFPGDSIT